MSEPRRITPPGGDIEKLLGEVADTLGTTKQKTLMLAAAIGKKRGQPEPLAKRGEGIRFDVFVGAIDDGFIKALALAEKGNLSILGDPDACITIFEEYAHAGLQELQRIWTRSEDKLDELLRLTAEARYEQTGDIPGIDASLLRGLV